MTAFYVIIYRELLQIFFFNVLILSGKNTPAYLKNLQDYIRFYIKMILKSYFSF